MIMFTETRRFGRWMSGLQSNASFTVSSDGNFISFSNTGGVGAETNRSFPMFKDGSIETFTIQVLNSLGVDLIYTIRDEGASTTMILTIPTSFNGVAVVEDNIVVSQGDTISCLVTTTGATGTAFTNGWVLSGKAL